MVTQCLLIRSSPVSLRGARQVPRSCRLHSLSNGWKQTRLGAATAVADLKAKEDAVEEVEEVKGEVEEFEDDTGLTTHQVQEFLTVLCEDTEIAECELKLGGFQLHVRRSLKDNTGSSAASSPAPAAASAATPAPAAAPTPAPVAPVAPLVSMSIPSFDEEEEDESLVLIGAPKVGIFRRGRYIKGKKVGKGVMVNEGDKVKAGQVIAYIEQLGTFVPVESPQAGEIASFLVEEGSPVEYKEPLLELAPFFGGHIIGDRKNA